jgi:putative ABC transport system permease protein
MRAFIREVVWDLRGNRVNAGLSFLALLVAMLSFVLISVLSRIGTDALVAQSEQLNGRAVTIRTTLPTKGWSIQRVAEINGSINAWPSGRAQGSLVLDHSVTITFAAGRARSATLRLVSPHYRAIRRITLTGGRWLGSGTYPGEVAVNTAAAALLGPARHPLRVDYGYSPSIPMDVVGVVADGNPQPVVYADVQGFEGGVAVHRQPDQAVILAHTDEAGQSDAVAMVKESAVRAGVDAGLDVSRSDEAAQIRSSLSVLSTVFLVVALIGLVVAVLGMVNVGLASVRERARDFTIRRAMGATRSRVIASVAAGTLVVGIGATAVAVGFSYGATALVLPILVDPATGIGIPPYPWTVACAAAGCGLLASLLSGLAPALRTRSLDLAALLRE